MFKNESADGYQILTFVSTDIQIKTSLMHCSTWNILHGNERGKRWLYLPRIPVESEWGVLTGDYVLIFLGSRQHEVLVAKSTKHFIWTIWDYGSNYFHWHTYFFTFCLLFLNQKHMKKSKNCWKNVVFKDECE